MAGVCVADMLRVTANVVWAATTASVPNEAKEANTTFFLSSLMARYIKVHIILTVHVVNVPMF